MTIKQIDTKKENAVVVQILNDLLAKAKNGEISDIAIAAVNDDKTPSIYFAFKLPLAQMEIDKDRTKNSRKE
ncbi:MAG: hypothetical protein GY928_27400 [Colwellia sp.]|nr:hypothetical protein [Colwellia sp.]